MRVREWLDRWGDWALALGLMVETEAEVASAGPAQVSAHGGRGPIGLVVAVVALSLVGRRRRPVTALMVSVAGVGIAGLLLTRSDGVPVGIFLALLVGFYTVGAAGDERRVVAGGALGLSAIAAVDLRFSVFQPHGARPGAWLGFVLAWVVGREVRRRRQEMAALRERTHRLELQREAEARSAVADERARIARELHDVVAHSVSVMVVQAQAGTRLLGDPDQARGAFRSIEASGREALVELRRLLGILRTGDHELAIGPQPGLGSLKALVEQVRDAGLAVHMRVEGEPGPIPPGVDLSAYRIVQEALTNTLKHAGPAEAEIVVRYGASALELEVTDTGAGADGRGNGAGHGLIGMRERAALYGGELEVGRGRGGGFAVRARLPLAGGR